ncbi:MAG: hypothetical protein C6I01_01850 [Epsilonproteobacteria bacterium]|nr:hypothetical protein [Campylobacterota bacterium]
MEELIKKLQDEGKISQEVANVLLNKFKEVKQKLTSLEKEKSQLEETLKKIEVNKTTLQKQLETLEEKIKKAKEEGKNEVVKLLEEERLSKESLQRELEELKKQKEELQKRTILQSILQNYEVIDPELVEEVLLKRVKVIEGQLFLNNLPLKEGVEQFFKEKPHLIRAKGTPGSGGSEKDIPTTDNGEVNLTQMWARKLGIKLQ